MQRHTETARVLDAAQVQDLGAGRGQFQHFLAGDPVDLPGGRDNARIGGVDAVDVGEDLAHIGVERRGQGHRRRVRAAAAQRGDFVGGAAHALEAGDDRNVPLVQGGADAVRVDVDDPGLAVDAVGDHAGLGSGEGLGRGAELVDGHGQQRHGDAFAGGKEHVHFAGGGGIGDLAARSRSSSVVSPMADTTTTTSSPAFWASTIRRATRLMPSASATEEPPNFFTTRCLVAAAETGSFCGCGPGWTSVVGKLMRAPSLDHRGYGPSNQTARRRNFSAQFIAVRPAVAEL